MSDVPLITLFVYAFNHEKYIREAIEGAFAQTYSPLEIILSDDCSSDRTFAVMEEMASQYNGPHKLVLNRNETNLGITAHLNKIMEMSTGEWLVLGAGDDVSAPERVSTIMEAVGNQSDIYAVSTGLLVVDDQTRAIRYQTFQEHRPYITGASMAWRRECWDVFGPLTCESTAEDVIIPFRALLLGKFALADIPTVKYRLHRNCTSCPVCSDHLAALKHLQGIKSTLLAACKQRLSDMERVKNGLDPELYRDIKQQHDEIAAKLECLRENIQQTVSMWEAGIRERVAYLVGMQPRASKHQSAMCRVKNFLLAPRWLRSGYFGLQRLLRRRQDPSVVEPTHQIRLIELQDVRDPDTGPLICL